MVSATAQLKITANDGMKYKSDTIDSDGVMTLLAEFPSKISSEFIAWLTRSEESVDGKSKQKAQKQKIRVQTRFCSKITLSPDYPTIKFTLFSHFAKILK